MKMLHPSPDMLVRVAQGDAFGMAAEYVNDVAHVERVLRSDRYLKHPVHHLRPGCYTDDTQMSVAVAEVMIDGAFTREAFADAFVRCYHRDRRDGYARHFQALLDKTKTGADLLSSIRPDSDKNGAAMRSVPIGVLDSPVEVAMVAELQARITHDTDGGVESSRIVALASHYAMYLPEPLSDLPEWLSDMGHAVAPWTDGSVVGPGVGIATARAAVTLASECKTIPEALLKAVEWGGDTDTVAAVAAGIMAPRHAPPPDWMEHGLEPGGKYGAAFLRDLGTRLMAKYA